MAGRSCRIEGPAFPFFCSATPVMALVGPEKTG